eukprot:gene407-2131_t
MDGIPDALYAVVVHGQPHERMELLFDIYRRCPKLLNPFHNDPTRRLLWIASCWLPRRRIVWKADRIVRKVDRLE